MAEGRKKIILKAIPFILALLIVSSSFQGLVFSGNDSADALIQWGSKACAGGKAMNYVYTAGVLAALYTAEYLWPDIFGGWFGFGFGTLFATMQVADFMPFVDDVKIRYGFTDATASNMKKLNRYPNAVNEFSDVVDDCIDGTTPRWLDPARFSHMMDNVAEGVDLNEVRLAKIPGYMDDYAARTGRDLMDDSVALKTKLGDKARVATARVMENGYDSRIIRDMRVASDANVIGTNVYGTKTIGQIVSENGMTMSEFYALKNVPLDALDDATRASMIQIRNSIPNPTSSEWCSKVIKVEDIQKYTSQELTGFKGFTSRYTDVSSISTPQEMIDSLRLREFGYDGQTEIGMIKFKPDIDTRFQVPTSETYTGTYPYTGTGFTGATNGRIVAESIKISENIPNGAELWKMHSDGTWQKLATYIDGSWR